MLNDIKKELLNHPDKLKEILEYFGYCNVVVRPKYLQFGRAIDASKKSIVIKLENNQYLYVRDFARNIEKDLFGYISEQKRVDFPEVLSVIKDILHITDYYDFFDSKGIFGGFYERVRKRNVNMVRTYENSILDHYIKCGNLRFLNDNISLEAQRFFNIMYDVESQGIVIPIYSQLGQLMGAKVRCNYNVPDGEMKYYYLTPCQMSSTLYGLSHNYSFLAGNVILIFESEKSVMQCYSYGIRNCVALGSGSISPKQIQMLYELNPKALIFMHDVGFEFESIMRNINISKSYSRFSEINFGYWNYFNKNYKNKISPSDSGKDELLRILHSEIKMIGSDDDDEL